jgi:predicted transcriptional regulator
MCLSSVELSDDIRGERLRFVEAMKEATAINVQSMISYCSPVATIELTVSV